MLSVDSFWVLFPSPNPTNEWSLSPIQTFSSLNLFLNIHSRSTPTTNILIPLPIPKVLLIIMFLILWFLKILSSQIQFPPIFDLYPNLRTSSSSFSFFNELSWNHQFRSTSTHSSQSCFYLFVGSEFGTSMLNESSLIRRLPHVSHHIGDSFPRTHFTSSTKDFYDGV